MPQVEVNSFNVRASCLQVLDAPLGYIVTPIKIDVLQLVEPGSNVLYWVIRNGGALPDIENMQIHQSLADLGYSLVTDLAGGQRQSPEVEQTTCNVNHGTVRDSFAEWNIQTLQTHTALGQVPNSNITDVVTGSQV